MILDGIFYTKEHEWIKLLGANKARVGITDHAQHELGDIVFVELPEIGRKVKAAEAVAVVESVKSVADVYAPAAGEITGRNDGLDAATINADPYDKGWLFEMTLEDKALFLSPDEYRKHIGE